MKRCLGSLSLPLVLANAAACSSEPGIQRPNCFLPVPEVPTSDCSAGDEKRFVDGVMGRHYLFNAQLPDLDRTEFETADALLRALIEDVDPPDRFSFIASRSGEVRFFEEGKILGLGFNLRFVGDDLFLSQVFGSQPGEPPSPASEAGLRRGDRLTAVGGRSVVELVANDELDAAFGPNEPGLAVDIEVESPEGERRSVALERDFFVFDPVPVFDIFRRSDRTIGYVVLRSFVEPAVTPLAEAMSSFRREGVNTVILDLRYNSGGLISVARALGELLVGRPGAGEVLFRRVYNEDNASCLETDRLAPRDQSLDVLDRVVAITLGGTASASEQLVSGLRPHTEVFTAGQLTFGKPVGQLGFAFCEDRVLRPVTFRTVNANGEGDYFGGIEPDCEAMELVDGELGDPGEAMLAAALVRAATDGCDRGKTAIGWDGRRRGPGPRGPSGRTLRVPGRPPGAELIF